MPLSTRRIVRGGAIGPLPGKTHKHLSDRSKNCAVFRGRQFVDRSAISSQSLHFWGRYEFLKFCQMQRDRQRNAYINFQPGGSAQQIINTCRYQDSNMNLL